MFTLKMINGKRYASDIFFILRRVPANLFETYPLTFNFKIDSLGQYAYRYYTYNLHAVTKLKISVLLTLL